MGKIGQKFRNLLDHGRKAFIPFFSAFYPSRELFRDFLLAADDVGVDFIEVGIPFSDPLADGKLIQYSSQWSLEKGFSFSRLLEEISSLGKRLEASLILMSYVNPIFQQGCSGFGRLMKEAAVEGVIVPDLPFEESGFLKESLSSWDIDLIYLLAPTTHSQRIKMISEHSHGFIYLVSLAGVTGMRERLPGSLTDTVQRVRSLSSKPLCVGFGISTPYQARKVAELSDGVIVGSALIHLLRGREQEKGIAGRIQKFLKDLRKSV